MITALGVTVATLVSEDLACITAGLLVQRGVLSAPVAILSCALGIFVGDLGLWALGRFAGAALTRWSTVSRISSRVHARVASSLAARVRAGAGPLILASRFTPGTRLPLYVASGLLGVSFGSFAGWSFLAVALWTPPLVLGSAVIGDAVAVMSPQSFGKGLLPAALAAGAMIVVIRALRVLPRRRLAGWLAERA